MGKQLSSSSSWDGDYSDVSIPRLLSDIISLPIPLILPQVILKFTPQKSSSISNYALHTKDFTFHTRGSLTRDLARKEEFDMPILEHYLKAEKLSLDWVAECRQHLSDHKAVKNAVRALRNLQKYPPKEPDVFEFMEENNWGGRELSMYPHLVSDSAPCIYGRMTSSNA